VADLAEVARSVAPAAAGPQIVADPARAPRL
jgi:hypothetical protein